MASGKQKAAMVLMGLDSATATELLKGLSPDDVQEIGLELAKLDASGLRNSEEQVKVTREFCEAIRKQSKGVGIKGFLNEVLVSIVGRDKAEQIKGQIKKATDKRDPFGAIRAASTDELVLALRGEHQQTIAVVLSELPTRKSQEILSLLDEQDRLNAVCKLTTLETLGGEVKQRIATMVAERLKTFKGETLPEGREQTLRRLALMLGGLEKNLRDQLLAEIRKHDEETCTMIQKLMITWEDIPSIADRSLQESLRGIESGKLAVALYGAEERIIQKIKSNISERAAAMLDEEISLMQEPLEKEILDAREMVVKPLREANEAGILRFTQR
jgi:flagellar motor switch protein FliG